MYNDWTAFGPIVGELEELRYWYQKEQWARGGGGMVRMWMRLGEAGVRLPWAGNLTRHFVFQSSFSENKKGMLLLTADTGLRLHTHARTPCVSFVHIRMHTHKHTHQYPRFIHSNPHMPEPKAFLVTCFHTPFLNELHFPWMVPFKCQKYLYCTYIVSVFGLGALSLVPNTIKRQPPCIMDACRVYSPLNLLSTAHHGFQALKFCSAQHQNV